MSLGSDDDSDDDGSEDYEGGEGTGTGGEKGKGKFKKTAQAWGLERPLGASALGASTLLTPVPSSRSFFTSAKAVAGGRAGAQQNGKRAK